MAEAVTNLAAAPVGAIEKVKLSANWMCACGEDGEDAALFDTVRAVGLEFCPALGVSIPVGKDSLSMRAVWSDSGGEEHTVAAPLSLVVSAFAPVTDVRGIVTPELKPQAETRLLLVDLGRGRDRLGGSCLAQVHGRLGEEVPDVEPADVRGLFAALQRCWPRACCWPATTAPTAASSPARRRWPSPAGGGCACGWPKGRTLSRRCSARRSAS